MELLTGIYWLVGGAILAVILLGIGAHYDVEGPMAFIAVIGCAVLLYYLIQDCETRVVVPDIYAEGEDQQ